MSYARGKKTKGFRSKLESRVATRLKKVKLPYEYETQSYPYTIEGDYTPDFFLDNGAVLEVKGVLMYKDRVKMAAVRKAHPDLRIIFVFQKPKAKCPGLKMTHAEWAEKYNFEWTGADDFKKKDFT